jgi:hypothetical protein
MEEVTDVLIVSHYDMVMVKWQALIGLEAVSKSYSCVKNLTFCNVFVFG